ncbi:MAG: hypothetical protein CVT59_02485 [Actinobacteria bacterium HGW-Actinobacteria-1]|nr:MAG: hypothetical protein CVT59_02485 [Actinobacteria bacterium HGW-Actinobacteria-1]
MHLLKRDQLRGLRIVGIAAALFAVVAMLGLAGCSSSLPAAGNVQNKAAKTLEDKGVRIIDVRTTSEFEAGHIPEAENVPLDQLSAAMGSWDKTEPILVYCATGSRSVEAMQILVSAGFTTVYNLQNGIVAWDGDVTSGPGGTVVGSLAPSASGLPVLYEFYTDW